MPEDVNALKARAESHGQGHLFQFFSELSSESRNKLIEQVSAIEFSVVDKLIAEFLEGAHHAEGDVKLEPPPVIPLPSSPLEKQAEKSARDAGDEAFRKGRVGCFLVAGGQGTRLGLNGPKGAFKVGPITDRTLFQIHAEKILALRRRYKTAVPWLIMTSDANDAETKAFFNERHFFGMGENTIRIFKQANLPAVSRSGKILLHAKDEIALSPNGHGGSIKALWDSGAIAWIKSIGVDTLFYFQVDNVLTNIGDPVFIGHHVRTQSQMSTKVCRKRDWKEKVGVLGLRNGRLSVIEYSDLPEAVAREVGANGQLKWWAGNIAIHVLDVGFIEKLNQGGFQLPYHKAEKAVPNIGSDGQPAVLKPGEKNGVKFETFVFDALSQADTTLNVETSRLEDFSPIKNAEGEDSPQTARRDFMEQYARWLTTGGAQVPRHADGTLNCRIEISPLTSLDGENLKAAPRKIEPGSDLLL